MTLPNGLLQRASQSSASQEPDSHSPASRCPQCGGSGILRLADQRYRTCLDCLGQGQVLQAELQRQPAMAISVSASSAAR
jgi:DnaJ-class molecular chaperone